MSSKEKALRAEIKEIKANEAWKQKACELLKRSLDMAGCVSIEEVEKTETYIKYLFRRINSLN